LSLYNLAGQRIKTLFSGTPTTNLNYLLLNKQELASGVYFVQLKSAGSNDTRKLVFLK
jgi:hypothetical protein